MDRNCDKCIHHTSGMCDSWDCKMQTVEGLVKETREKAIEEFAEAVRNAYATMQSISEIERATANTIVMGIEAELKGE